MNTMWMDKHLYTDDPARGWLPWGALAPLLAMVFVVLAILPIDLLMRHHGLVGEDETFTNVWAFAFFLFASFGLLLLIVIGWLKLVERRALASIGLGGERKMATLFKQLVLGAAVSGAVVLLIATTGGFRSGAWFPAFGSVTDLAAITLLLAGFIVQSGAEELLFRGWLLSVLTRKFNLLLAVLISSALFTLLHFSPDKNLFAHVNSFLFSVFACYLVLVYRNVWAAAGFHAGWNWLIGTGFDLPLTGIDLKIAPLLVQLTPVGPSWLNGGSGGPENTLACTVVTFFAILVAHRALIMQGRNKVA
jgi:membrane protease YdiL (CAAX protease family)